MRRMRIVKGTVKWFSNQKGYGFIVPAGQEKEVFVHHSSIQGDGYKTLKQGEEVDFEVSDGPKGEFAVDVVRSE